MKILRYVWDDIRKGENLDLYGTIIVAFLLVFLNLFGETPQPIVNAVLLAILGFLAISSLVSRYHFEALAQNLKEAEKQRLKLLSLYESISSRLGTQAEIIFEPIERGTGSFYRRLTEFVRDTHSGDEIVVMAHYRVGGGKENPRETDEYKKSRHEYSQTLLQKVREPGITYRRIICFDKGPVQGKIKPGHIREWLLEHSRELLEIKKHKPGKVSLKKGTVVFGPDIFLVKDKVAVISLDIRDPISSLVHTDGTLIFHNPPDAKIIEHLYDFCMIADDGSIAVDSIPEG